MPSLQEEIKAPFLKAYSSTASQNYSPCPSFRHSFNPSWFCVCYHCPLFKTCTSVYISELSPKPTSIYYVISLKTVCVREFLHCGVTLILVLLLNRTQDLKKKKKNFLRVALSTHSLEKGMATHSSILAWRIPQTEEPGGLQSEGLQRVRHD